MDYEIENDSEFPCCNKIDTPSYTEFSLMDRPENDPVDVAPILNICESDE